MNKIIAIIGAAAFIIGCTSIKEIDNDWAKNRNVCKKLQGKVLVYTIFVNDKQNLPWDEYEMADYMDSIQVATTWLEQEAEKNNIPLNIISAFHKKASKKGPPGKTNLSAMKMSNSLSGFKKINKHYDGIAKSCKTGFEKQEGALKPFVKKIKNKQSFVAMLRNQYKCESVVLLFAHKADKLQHLIISLNTLNNDDVEFLALSLQNPPMISFQILQLFGASALTFTGDPKRETKQREHVKTYFPMDIMAHPMASSLNDKDIGAYTQYLIGWKSTYDPKHKLLSKSRRVRVRN